jgi:hypothetical protein
MTETIKTAQSENDKRKRMRSPAYPYVNLETAIKRAREFYDKEQRNAAPLKVAVKHWAYEEKSSGGSQTAAALISFGLMTDEGTGEKRRVKLTDTALRILLDSRPDSEDRAQAIRIAALTPKIHGEIWKKWGSTLPSDSTLKHTLILDWKPPFNPASVDGFIKEYKDTIAFAKPDPSATVVVESDESDEKEEEDGGEQERGAYVPRVDDYVQWEHNGVLGFPEPRRIREISPDGTYVYVDGQHGGFPSRELIREKAPTITAKPNIQPLIKAPQSQPYMQEFVVPLSDGSKAVFQWPNALTKEDVDDLKDSLKILERKILRSQQNPIPDENKASQ